MVDHCNCYIKYKVYICHGSVHWVLERILSEEDGQESLLGIMFFGVVRV